jgi:hypothetical protein
MKMLNDPPALIKIMVNDEEKKIKSFGGSRI